jgi:CheY-like chemotaxis protein
MHILLIEPDRLQAGVYAQALQRNGHTVDHAVSAQGAVHLADETTPDVVVLELQLPGHNGIEFLYEFRSYYEWLHVPVIVHSFVPPHELAHAATLTKELNVVRTLYKPDTTLQSLCAVIAAAGPVTA